MGILKNKEPQLTRTQALAAVPVRAQGLDTLRSDDGKAAIVVVPGPKLRSAFMQRIAPVIRQRKVELDPVGTWVWDQIDGRADVKAIIGRFAEQYRVNRREAEVAITDFLKSLMKRGMIAMQIP